MADEHNEYGVLVLLPGLTIWQKRWGNQLRCPSRYECLSSSSTPTSELVHISLQSFQCTKHALMVRISTSKPLLEWVSREVVGWLPGHFQPCAKQQATTRRSSPQLQTGAALSGKGKLNLA